MYKNFWKCSCQRQSWQRMGRPHAEDSTLFAFFLYLLSSQEKHCTYFDILSITTLGCAAEEWERDREGGTIEFKNND